MDNDDLCSLVRSGGEDRDFDYKGPMAWDEKDKACISLVKDVLAMANTLGGFIIIGVSEGAARYVWDGLTDDQAKTWDPTRFGNKVDAYADPPIGARLRKVTCDDKTFVVISVPRFQGIPHICTKPYDKDGDRVLTAPTLYVRTSNCESAPLADAAGFHLLIERAVRTRQDQMLEAMRSVLTGASIVPAVADQKRFEEQISASLEEVSDPFAGKGYEAYFTDAMFPARFKVNRFDVEDLKRAAQAASINYGGWPFLFYQEDHPSVFVTNDGLQMELAWQPFAAMGHTTDSYEFWRLRRSGLLLRRTLLGEEAKYKAQGFNIVDPENIARHVAEAVDTVVRVYTSLGVTDEEITWRLAFSGAKDRELYSVMNSRYRGYVSRVPAIEHEQTHSIEDWRAGLIDHAALATLEIMQVFQWPYPGDTLFREWISRHLSRQV
jgi:hypothetical protein